MISKLLSRKRSYERMMQVSDNGTLSRGNQHLSTLGGQNQISASGIPIHSNNLRSQKSQEILLSVGKKNDMQPYGHV